MEKIVSVVFFVAWLLCGCSIESICDDWRAGLIYVVALAVTVLCAVVIGSNEEE